MPLLLCVYYIWTAGSVAASCLLRSTFNAAETQQYAAHVSRLTAKVRIDRGDLTGLLHSFGCRTLKESTLTCWRANKYGKWSKCIAWQHQRVALRAVQDCNSTCSVGSR